MSHEATTWAFAQHEVPTGAKFLLVAIANYADKYGVAYPGREALAEDCCCTPESVTRNMARLEELDLIGRCQRRRKNGSRTSDWIVLAPHRHRTPLSDAPPEEFPAEVVGLAAHISGDSEGVGHLTNSGGPEPSVEPSGSISARARTNGSRSANGNQQTFEGSDAPAGRPIPVTRKVDRKTVTKEEAALASEALAAFNSAAGTRYRSTEFLDKIVRRIREHPELGPPGHRKVIERNFANPWWKSDPNPSVIYGNAGVFESAMHVKDKRTAREASDFIARINAARNDDLD